MPSVMHAIKIHQVGGPEALTLDTNVPLPQPGPGEVQFQVAATGVNFIETYQRTGAYKATMPFIPGSEAAGTVAVVGDGVTTLKVGDRIATASATGTYAQYATAPANRIIKLPESIDLETASGVLFQGMTAHYLTHSSYVLKKGQTALIHAAAGGTGRVLVQVAKLLGATVIGTVSSDAKAQIAKEAGADYTINYTTTPDFDVEVKKLTGGQGVHVVYDSVGKPTFDKSLKSLRICGHVILFGQAGGAVPPIDPHTLMAGSFSITRPMLAHHIIEDEDFRWRSTDVLNWIQQGKVKIHIAAKFSLSKAGDAHNAIQSRDNAGKILLLPQVD